LESIAQGKIIAAKAINTYSKERVQTLGKASSSSSVPKNQSFSSLVALIAFSVFSVLLCHFYFDTHPARFWQGRIVNDEMGVA
jgi:hypothetical protein